MAAATDGAVGGRRAAQPGPSPAKAKRKRTFMTFTGETSGKGCEVSLEAQREPQSPPAPLSFAVKLPLRPRHHRDHVGKLPNHLVSVAVTEPILPNLRCAGRQRRP